MQPTLSGATATRNTLNPLPHWNETSTLGQTFATKMSQDTCVWTVIPLRLLLAHKSLAACIMFLSCSLQHATPCRYSSDPTLLLNCNANVLNRVSSRLRSAPHRSRTTRDELVWCGWIMESGSHENGMFRFILGSLAKHGAKRMT
jgi:hypothetical protein